MQRQISNSDRGLLGKFASRIGAVLALATVFLLSACDGTGSSSKVTDVSQTEPGKDGVPPVLTVVTILPNGIVESGDQVRIDFTASEALMTPVVFVNGVRANVTGKIAEWSARYDITDTDPDGFITFSIAYQDISGELGQAVTATTDGTFACIGPECPVEDDLGPLEGNWKLDFAGVGPAPGDTTWFNISDTGPEGPRACWFDDLYTFGRDGSFGYDQGAETWIEAWQGAAADGCGAPVAPHDGSNAAIFEYDDVASTLKLTGVGAFLGLAKAVNGSELALPADAPESVTYQVAELIGNSLTVRVEAGTGVWWEFRLTRVSNLPIVGKWKLNFAGVGPAAGDTSWFSIADTGPDGPRACWFDDIHIFGGDGSFQNFQDGETWVETWQGAAAEGCGVPVAPHDGSSPGTWYYDDSTAVPTVRLDGTGSFLGLAKAVNGAELADPANTPAFVTYEVVELVGDSLTVRIEAGTGVWWQFGFERVADTKDLKGDWKLDFAGVGPAAGDTTWFNISDTGPDGPRACWFDDLYSFGRDGSFAYDQGGETWVEAWQGAAADGCGVPVAPHDGSNTAIFEYDDVASTLKLTGTGAFLGLAKAVNGSELAQPADAPGSVTYEVAELVGDSLTVRVEAGAGVWWEFRLSRVSSEPVVGNWKLGFAGVGPAAGDTSWFSIADTGADGPRACWFDDVYHFGVDGSFQNFQDGESWIETWQGAAAEGCGVPVAPHDGSAAGSWYFDDSTANVTLELIGVGSYLGLPKVVNGAELADPAATPASVTYQVVEVVGGAMTVRIEAGTGVWWEYDLVKE